MGMTDHDNLRDRIAEVIDVAADAWQNSKTDQRDELHAIAQAIIDEFGMTVETEPGHDPRECGCISRAYPAESRIVGKWVKQ